MTQGKHDTAKTDVRCDQCGKVFYVSHNATKYGVPSYCSEACGIRADQN